MIKIKNKTLANYIKVNTNSLEGDPGETADGLIVPSQSVVKQALNQLADNKQDNLISGTNIKTINNNSLLGDGNIDTSQIFIARYNETSYADIERAYQDDKLIICEYYGNFNEPDSIDTLSYSLLDAPVSVFFSFRHYRINDYIIFNCDNSGWSFSCVDIAQTKEDVANKVTSLSSSSTDEQYISAKCAYDNLQTKVIITYDI